MKLFPEISPYNTGYLQVSELHTLYFEEVGNPEGKPVVFLHGGPGGGISSDYRRYFDPEFYRVILFDQRGCGKSKPHAELLGNTTWDLVEDIEKLRLFLSIKKWVVFGGSWGSTLALSYAITHPAQVKALVLRGIFLIRKKEIDWFYQQGASKLFPEIWKNYLAVIPKENQDQMVRSYYTQLTSDDYETRIKSAKAWSQWEAATSKLSISQELINEFEDDDLALAFARIECHYFYHNAWIEDDHWLLKNAKKKLSKTPTFIVHGRYDVVCPVENAFELKEALPHATLEISPNSGHSASELETTDTLLLYMEKVKALY